MANNVQIPDFDNANSVIDPHLPDSVNNKLIDSAIKKVELDNDVRIKEQGYLGKFFGCKEHSARNIAGLLIFLLVFIAAVYTTIMIYCNYSDTHTQVLDFWNIVIPVITLSMGYLFGFVHGSKD